MSVKCDFGFVGLQTPKWRYFNPFTPSIYFINTFRATAIRLSTATGAFLLANKYPL